MTYIIGMISQKGGAGKSTLARLFARELAQDDFTVKIADLDTQQATCTEWAIDRSESGIQPEIEALQRDFRHNRARSRARGAGRRPNTLSGPGGGARGRAAGVVSSLDPSRTLL